MERPEYVEVASCAVSLAVAGNLISVCMGMVSVGCGWIMVAA